MRTKNGWGTRRGKWYVRYNNNSTKSVRRQYLKQHIINLSPTSILEFGCAGGCNLQLYPHDINLVGIDANEYAIGIGQQQYPHIQFYEMDITKRFDLNKKFDIVFSMGVLIHIHPEDIEQVLNNMLVHTNKYLILCEGYVENDYTNEKNNEHYRAFYNYHNLLPGIIIEELPKEIQSSSSIATKLHLMTYKI